MSTRPILITGCPRSGTTWLGSTVGASKDVIYVYEPFNDDAHHHLRLPARCLYLTDASGEPYRESVGALLGLGELSSRTCASARSLMPWHRECDDLAATLALRELVKRPRKFMRARRVCLKDPLAFFSAEWLSATFGA